MRIMILILACLVVAGCAQTVWHKAGVTQAEFNKDAYECEKDARQSGHFGTGIVGAIAFGQFQERCMVARGYSKMKVESEEEAWKRSQQPSSLPSVRSQSTGNFPIGDDLCRNNPKIC
jgi:hypothetical protein